MSQSVTGSVQISAVILNAAASQHGVVTRAQLLERGVARHRIDYRIACGMLTPLYRGVYSVAPVAGRLERQFAAVLAVGDESFVSHRAAAAILELVPPLAEGAPVEISTRRDVRIGGPGIRIHRVSRLEPDEVTIRCGLPLTTPARTLIDLAATSDSRELERALATAIRKRVVQRESVEALLARYPRLRGRGRIGALLAAGGGPAFTRSEAERRLLDLIRAGDLPQPETNTILEGFEVDFLWRRERLVVEVDGREYHSGLHAFERDRDRDAVLTAAGHRTMRVTWRQITQQPCPLIVRIAQALVR